MTRIAKATYTEEFKVAAVQLIDARRQPAEVAREIGSTTIRYTRTRAWVTRPRSSSRQGGATYQQPRPEFLVKTGPKNPDSSGKDRALDIAHHAGDICKQYLRKRHNAINNQY
nr:hypothetical protein [Oxalobacteraceae bacterium]